jgi:acetyl esterase/lipase
MEPIRLIRPLFASVVAALFAFGAIQAQEKKDEPPKKDAKKDQPKKEPPKPPVPPTAAAAKYGLHDRNVLDFFQAKSDKPTPVVFCIHGGGWSGGDKSGYYGRVTRFLDSLRRHHQLPTHGAANQRRHRR